MNIKEFEKIIIQVIKKILNKSENNFEISKDMPLIGSGSPLDSMKIVELCIELEDFAEENGFDFDWTSEKAMSKSLSMFSTVESLAKELLKQSEEKL